MEQALETEERYDIVAIQEPSRSSHTGTPMVRRGGRLEMVYDSGRAAIFVSKRLDKTTWSTDGGTDWAAGRFGTGQEALTIYSVYSESHRSVGWQSPVLELTSRERLGHSVLVGDFNAHHPLWDREDRVSPEIGPLLRLAEDWDLLLHTPWGEPTRRGRRSGERDSTIDHAWGSRGLDVRYLGPTDLAGSDHAAQVIEISTTQTGPAQASDGYSWRLMDREMVECMAHHLTIPPLPTTVEELEAATEQLMLELGNIASASTLRRKPSTGTTAPWWDRTTKEATKRARKAERVWRRTRTDRTLEDLKRALADQAKEIRRARTRVTNLVSVDLQEDRKSNQLGYVMRESHMMYHSPGYDTTELRI
ncbi:endonuclease-reverse transcriptase domain-containing protein [Penicillium sp. DV-2018c]|nr:endonuclease-reverse transcriptase domain-containing protein [Penicillium sp. DV-2018c]